MTPRVIVKKLIRRWSISSSARCCDRHALLMISWFTTMSQKNVSDNGSDWCSDTTRRRRWFTGHLPGQQRHRHSTHTKSILRKKQHITDQQNDETLTSFYDDLVSICDIDDHNVCYYTKSGILMRNFRPSDAKLYESWRIRHQIVLPQSYRDNILSIVHDIPLAGHLGANKTTDRILLHFFWPGIRGRLVA